MKTIPNRNSVKDFLEAVLNQKRKADADTIVLFLEELTVFSPRKHSLLVHIMNGCERYGEQLKAMGPHKVGKSCLYIKSLQDINLDILKDIITDSMQFIQKNTPNYIKISFRTFASLIPDFCNCEVTTSKWS